MDNSAVPVDDSRQGSTSDAPPLESSQTAQDFITSQLSLEADAREALPYQFDSCTRPLGPLRQSVYACLTCTPPPASAHQQFAPAGVCYSCSISCHGEHNLVELFCKRDFVCDCGTTRLINSGTPCSLRTNAETGRKGGVVGEEARPGNKYNQNFQGKFCGCGDEYDPETEKGTMYQCLGLGTEEDGGCGEDWWHPECLMGLPRAKASNGSQLETIKENDGGNNNQAGSHDPAGDQPRDDDDAAPPPGFPDEDAFDHLLCYKCVNAFPWIKPYANTPGFLTAATQSSGDGVDKQAVESTTSNGRKRSLEDYGEDDSEDSNVPKRAKQDPAEPRSPCHPTQQTTQAPKHTFLPQAPSGNTSLYLLEDFRSHLCRCASCFPHLAKHPQLLEEEVNYEPPLSEPDNDANGDNASLAGRSVHSGGSLLDRGEAALSNMDRVRAIEGVMAYNHVRDKVKAFLQPFAESGQAVGAEDIKAYFAKLRGDEQAVREAGSAAVGGGMGGDGDNRREQGGY